MQDTDVQDVDVDSPNMGIGPSTSMALHLLRSTLYSVCMYFVLMHSYRVCSSVVDVKRIGIFSRVGFTLSRGCELVVHGSFNPSYSMEETRRTE